MFKLKLSEVLDKFVLLLAMFLFLVLGISALRNAKFLDSISGGDRPLLSEMKVNIPNYEIDYEAKALEAWESPESQTRGEEWMFDLFTPPVIYYDPVTREFAVTPPNYKPKSDDDRLWSLFDLALVEVRLRPYPLQLVGYAGDPGSFVAYFEDVSSGRITLIREGATNEEYGVSLIGFEERQVEVLDERSMPVRQGLGVARLMDHASGLEINLTNRETKMFSDLEARVRDLRDGRVLTLKSGSRVEMEDCDYLIGDLSTDPEQASITKISKDGLRRFTLVLSPISQSNGESSPAKTPKSDNPFSVRPNLRARPIR